MKRPAPAKSSESASERITARIVELDDWRGETLTRIRSLLHEVDPDIVEEWKWRGTPVWSHGGIVCTGEAYTSVVKMTFAKGASLDDPKKLFNSSLEGNTRRAIDVREGDKLDPTALKALFRAAIALNRAGEKARPASKTGAHTTTKAKTAAKAKTATKANTTSKAKTATKANTTSKAKSATKAKSAAKAKTATKANTTAETKTTTRSKAKASTTSKPARATKNKAASAKSRARDASPRTAPKKTKASSKSRAKKPA